MVEEKTTFSLKIERRSTKKIGIEYNKILLFAIKDHFLLVACQIVTNHKVNQCRVIASFFLFFYLKLFVHKN